MSLKLNAKAQARQVLDRLPDECTIEDIQHHLYVADKIERRIRQADAGEHVAQEEAERRLAKWRFR